MKQPSKPASEETKSKRPLLRWVLVLLGVLVLAGLVWCRWVYIQIEHYASHDQAAPADAIAVFGAAEYDGHPSPVFRARLDHAQSLYSRGIAPLIITLGGDGGDQFSEGAVGQQYLEGAGVPESDIIAETESTSTEQSGQTPRRHRPHQQSASHRQSSATARTCSASTRSAPPTASTCSPRPAPASRSKATPAKPSASSTKSSATPSGACTSIE